MSEHVLAYTAATHARPHALDTILYGGSVMGILDEMFVLIFYGPVLKIRPVRIFQAIASGIQPGKAAYEG